MRVSLISYTQNAEDLLIFTKNTRLEMNPTLLKQISEWSHERKMEELAYIANTIPSSWEFVDYTFLVEGVSRAYTHQQVRTRSASYAQQSMRVLDMGRFDYIYTERNMEDDQAYDLIDELMTQVQDVYRQLIELGQPIEDARGILPTNISTNIVCKFNLRVFAGLVQTRTGGRTQSEYQQVVEHMLGKVLQVHPWAHMFLLPEGKDRYKEIEEFAKREFRDDLKKKGELLKIVDKMRKEKP